MNLLPPESTRFPILQPSLWTQISQRLYPASVPYLKKLGIVGKKVIPSTTIDQYFQVCTSGPNDGGLRQSAKYVDFVTRRDLGNPGNYQLLDVDICPSCGHVMTFDGKNGQRVCHMCGESHSMMFMVSTTNGSHGYGGPVAAGVPLGGTQNGGHARRLTTYMYKRTNHFLDHLKRVQGKETSAIKPCVLAAVENELRKERIDYGDPRITTSKVRSILKKLKLQKYYNHVFAITARLTGRAAPQLSVLQEEKLLTMFQTIQEPFQKHCPADRTNMISYSYVLRKLVEILGWHNLIDYFPLLKSRHKVYLQDCIWKKICDDVGFEFHKSIS